MDESFLAVARSGPGDAALDAARKLGASHTDVRIERLRSVSVASRDGRLERTVRSESAGLSVRVIAGGAWGFAATADLTAEAAVRTAERAVGVARALAPLNAEPVELAEEPVHKGTWTALGRIDPFSIPDDERVAWICDLSSRGLGPRRADHMDASAVSVVESKYLASSSGTETVQERVRSHGGVSAVKLGRSGFETMRTCVLPSGRGWEHFAGWEDEVDLLPELAAEKLDAPSIEPGRYDLVIDPTNLWLTIHESIGHATELDRALGYEAAYAGTSFATIDKLGWLRYGSPVMHVTGDRTVEHGLATVAWDDEGVAAQSWDIVRDGILVGYQLNRQMARKPGFGRSNGCAFADGPGTVPLQRMPNVSLQPSPDPVTIDDLIGGVEDGIYIVGDKSWSIDMQRSNFQFTGQRFYRIRGGKLTGQVRDVAYQATTTDFWNAMDAVGGPGTWLLGGAFNCGKGQPGQIAPVSHGCPAARFRGVWVLNASREL